MRLPFFCFGTRGMIRRDVTFVVRRDAFEPADRNRFLFGAHAPARRLARPIARAPENSGEHVGVPVQHVRFGVLFLRNQTDVFRNRGMRGTCPLAIDNFMKVGGLEDIGGFHNAVQETYCLGRGKIAGAL